MVGAVLDDDNAENSGAVYVFKYDGNNWIEMEKLIASDGKKSDRFGQSVSIEEEYAIIGAPWDTKIGGSAYVFKYDGNNWVETDIITPLNVRYGDFFGDSISIKLIEGTISFNL